MNNKKDMQRKKQRPLKLSFILIAFLMIGFIQKNIFAKQRTRQENIDLDKKDTKELINHIKNNRGFEALWLFNGIAKHSGETAIPAFTEMLWNGDPKVEAWAVRGLGEIGLAEGAEPLIKKYKEKALNRVEFSNDDAGGFLWQILDSLGKINDVKVDNFLEEIMNNSKQFRIKAAFYLYKHKRNLKAEEVLIERLYDNGDAPGLITFYELPELWKNRREDFIKVCTSVLKNPKFTLGDKDEEIYYSSEILLGLEYEKVYEVLYEAMNIQKSDYRNGIIRSLIKSKDPKVKELLKKIRDNKNIKLEEYEIVDIEEVLKN